MANISGKPWIDKEVANDAKRYFNFNYTTENIGPGRTKIKWKFTSNYNKYFTDLDIYCRCVLTVTVTKGELEGTLPSYKQTSWEMRRFANGATYDGGPKAINKEGSFIINHTAEGKGAFRVVIDGSIYSTANDNGTEEPVTVTLEDNYPYTAVTAPTTFTIEGSGSDPSRVKPGGTITLKWSGAKAGVANAITGYKIYYKITSTGTAPDGSETGSGTLSGLIAVTTTSSSSSRVFTVPGSDDYRGYKIAFAIRTIGTQSGYSSDLKNSSKITINKKPQAPTITFSKTKLPHLGGTVDVSFSSTYSVYYSTSTSTSGTKTLITSPKQLTIEPPNSNYYFWNYDGLEYSEQPTTKKITFNVLPRISPSFTSGEPYTSVNLADGQDNYYISRGIKLSITDSDSSSFTNTWYVYYRGVDDEESDYTKKKITSSSSLSLSVADIRKYTGIPNKNLQYYYAVDVYDGYDHKEITINKSNLYYLPKKLTSSDFVSCYNTDEGKNQSNANENHFYNILQFYLKRDTGFPTAEVEIKNKQTDTVVKTTSASIAFDGNQGVFSLEGLKSLTAGKTYIFNIYLKKGDIKYLFKTIEKTKVPSPTPLNSALSPTSFSPYSDKNNASWGTWYIGNYGITNRNNKDTINADLISGYSLTLGSFEFQLEVDGEKSTYTSTIPTWPDADRFKFTLSGDFLWNAVKELKLSNRNTYSGIIRLKVTNSFGQTSTATRSCKITYNDQKPSCSFTLQIAPKGASDDGANWVNYTYTKDGKDNLHFLKSELSVGFLVTVRDYYGLEKIEFLASTDGKNTWKTYKTKTGFTDLSTETDSLTTILDHKRMIITGSNGLADFSSVKSMYFKIIVTNKAGNSKTYTYGSYTYRPHQLIKFSIAEASYNATNKTITIKDTRTLYNYDNSISGEASITSTLPDGSKKNITNHRTFSLASGSQYAPAKTVTRTFVHDLKTAPYSELQIRYSTTQTLELFNSDGTATGVVVRTTKSGTSEVFIVHNAVPTIAYRSNGVGINTLEIDDDAILEIHSHSTRGKILLYSGEAKASIELSTSGSTPPQLHNFIIDGGTW